MDKDSYYKKFTLLDYRFIVANRKSLLPLVWVFPDTQKEGTLYYGKNKQIVLRDPVEIGEELNYYLSFRPSVPKGIEICRENDIIDRHGKI